VKTFLFLLFGAIFGWMIVMTTRTSLEMPVWDAFDAFGKHPWAVATLWDAYFGFVTFYVWVAWKEKRLNRQILWFVLIMGLGNITMSLYVLIELFRLPAGAPPEQILTSRNG
jgi:hypothetical protein